jgi:hypothetical protein
MFSSNWPHSSASRSLSNGLKCISWLEPVCFAGLLGFLGELGFLPFELVMVITFDFSRLYGCSRCWVSARLNSRAHQFVRHEAS